MRLDALTAGRGAEASRFGGEIASVFARAVNIRLDSGPLLGLVAREVGAVPCGFQLATPPGFSFLDHCRTGARVAARAGLLRIDGTALSVDLRPAQAWRSRLDRYPIDCRRPDVAGAWGAAWRMVADHGGAVPLQRLALGAIAALLAAVQSARPDDARGAIARLIGLGQGLTPAGDDFLVGFLAGLATAPAPANHAAIRAAMAQAITGGAARTTAISRLFLDAALMGEVSEPLARLAAAIGAGDAASAASTAIAALAVGASSGAAASYGLLLAAGLTDPAIPPVAEYLRASAPRRDAIPPPGR